MVSPCLGNRFKEQLVQLNQVSASILENDGYISAIGAARIVAHAPASRLESV